MTNRSDFDFIIFGAGFAGSIMSMVLRQLGYSVLLLEKGKHPRFVIGESSTPFANLLLEQLSDRYSLPALRPLCEWGSWQKTYPDLPVGLKRGFTFYHHAPNQKLDWQNRRTQLLVAATPNDHVADTHWYRPAFDQLLTAEAQKLGVEYRDEFSVASLTGNAQWKIIGEQSSHSHTYTADFVIDATGANSVLADALNIPKERFPNFPPTSALYAHFYNVPRSPEKSPNPRQPYPPDAAAVHHVFNGGWIWILRFNNSITSAGAALTQDLASKIQLQPGNEAAAWNHLLSTFPSLQELFASATPITPFYRIDQLSFRRLSIAGRNWALLPSAAGFVDPLLSAGFALTLLGILRLAEIFQTRHKSQEALANYQSFTRVELDATADLVSALYSKMNSPEEFNLLTLLYFAALSYTETVYRLGKPELATNFLLNNNQTFRRLREEICSAARHGNQITRSQIAAAIEPVNIAGLTDWKRHNWYSADFRDLLANAQKVNSTPAEILDMLKHCGLPIISP